MKTKFFLLVGCLIAAVTLNAQTPEAMVVENSEAAVASNVYVDVWYMVSGDEGESYTVFVTMSEAISCDVMVKVQVRMSAGPHKNITFRLSPGEVGDSEQFTPQVSGAYITEIRAEDLYPFECDGKTIIYNI